jgi:preprotein translocase subunit SecE
MVKFTTIYKTLIWILLIVLTVLTILGAFFFIEKQVSNWNISSNWNIADNWIVGSTTMSEPLPVDGVTDFLRQLLESIKKESDVIFPSALGMLIISLIVKRRETIIKKLG